MSAFLTAFFKHYKTTLFGLIASAFNLLANGTGWKQVLMSTALGLLGLFAKDFNQTGQ